MRVLYGVQATGNGHLSRALEFYPLMKQYADVDVLLSGIQGDLKLPFPVIGKKHGAGYVFGKNGGIDYLRTLYRMKPLRFFYDTYKMDISEYDLIVSDFEPVGTWAAKRTSIERVGLSHQASFLSNKTPRPDKKSWFGEFVYKNFAPVDRYVGLHYSSYDKNIFTPVIRQEIRQLQKKEQDHVVIYLPAFSEDVYKEHLKKIKSISWKIFSKHTTRFYKEDNVEVYPIDNKYWMKYLSTAYGAIIGGGFASTSEMLYLGKRMLVLPMMDQYEQVCNSVALKPMGVEILHSIDQDFTNVLRKWLDGSKPVEVDYPDCSDLLVRMALGIEQ